MLLKAEGVCKVLTDALVSLSVVLKLGCWLAYELDEVPIPLGTFLKIS